jgi:hypothetical protein
VEPFHGVANLTHNHYINDQSQIHGKYESYQGSHMDDKAHEGIKVHQREGDGDSMLQPRCNTLMKNPMQHALTKHIDV